jgi:hypothetical protein
MVQKRGKKTDYGVDPKAFIEAWEASRTPQEVADKLKMPKAIVLARASNYRQAGVKLKKLQRRSKRAIDVEGLNRLIEDLRKRKKEEPTATPE